MEKVRRQGSRTFYLMVWQENSRRVEALRLAIEIRLFPAKS